MEQYLTPALLSVIVMLLGLVLRQGSENGKELTKLRDAQTTQSVALSAITVSLQSVVTRVDELQTWKNAQTEREMTDLRSTIDEYKQGAGRRSGDKS